MDGLALGEEVRTELTEGLGGGEPLDRGGTGGGGVGDGYLGGTEGRAGESYGETETEDFGVHSRDGREGVGSL